jgi:hypothetical protein
VVLSTQDVLENVPRLCELLDILGYIDVVLIAKQGLNDPGIRHTEDRMIPHNVHRKKAK